MPDLFDRKRGKSHIYYVIRSSLRGAPLKPSEAAGRTFTPLRDRIYPAEEKYVTLSSGKICYIDKGEGPTVVLVHGLGANVGRWGATVDSLVGSGYRVVAYDHPGFGKSDKGDHPYTVPFLTQQLTEFLNKLDLKKPTLIGHSMGGSAVLSYLLENPEHNQPAVVVSPAGIRHRHSLTAKFMASAFFNGWVARYIIPRALERCAVQRTDDVLDMIYQGCHVSKDPEWAGIRRSLLYSAMHLLEFSLLDRLAEIKNPLLVIWGEEDSLLSVNQALKIHEKLPLSRISILPECGHYPMLEMPDKFNALLTEFLSGKEYIEGCEH